MIRIWMVMLLAMLCGLFPACNTNDGGTEIPNEVVGKEFIAKGPAANAEIKLISVGHVPGTADSGRSILTTTTDAQGRFSIRNASPGLYNILASKDSLRSFRDSVEVTGMSVVLRSDTLAMPGSLTGWVGLEPQHDARSATVQVLGTTHFVNVGADGRFELADLGAGIYRLRVVSSEEGYAPLYREIAIRRDGSDTLADTLRPFYSRIPVVTGLKALALPDGIVKITWAKTSFARKDAYLVYRDPLSSLVPSQTPIGRTSDTVFQDTLYGDPPKIRPFSYLDSASHAFRYRVKISDLSGDHGPFWGGAEAITIPPSRQYSSGKWRQVKAKAAFPPQSGSGLVVFKDKLWLFGGFSGNGPYNLKDIWTSSDGETWARLGDTVLVPSPVVYAPVVFREKLWLVGTNRGEATHSLYNSDDGLRWTLVANELPPEGSISLSIFRDRLSWVSGSGDRAPNHFISSVDGKAWDSLPIPEGFVATHSTYLIAYAGGFWRIGGKVISGGSPIDIWKTLDGTDWVRTVPVGAFLPRIDHRMAASGGKLWSIGGRRSSRIGFEIEPGDEPLFDQVWFTEDGSDWSLMDAHAPFGQRAYPAVAYFKGRIWVVGGYSNGTFFNDVWSMETQ